jgi:hypothetical protein
MLVSTASFILRNSTDGIRQSMNPAACGNAAPSTTFWDIGLKIALLPARAAVSQ